MDSSLWVILFSKFSQPCQKLLNIISETNLNSYINFEILDIDNKEMRNKIKRSKTFKISLVPCIIRLEANGVASQYEGEKAFELVYKLVDIFMPPPPAPPQVTFIQQTPTPSTTQGLTRELTHTQSQVAPREAPQNNTKSTPIENLLDLDELEEEPQAPPVKTVNGKVSISSIMTEQRGRNEEPKFPPQREEIQSVKTGAKVNISEIMAQRP